MAKIFLMKFVAIGELKIEDGSFPGTFYKTSINKGNLALRMENGRTSKPGVLRIGVKLNEAKKEILMLARIHKTRNHDFYIKTFSATSFASYGVVKHSEDYDDNPPKTLGFPNIDKNPPLVNLNCDSDDEWVEPDTNFLERCHSPI